MMFLSRHRRSGVVALAVIVASAAVLGALLVSNVGNAAAVFAVGDRVVAGTAHGEVMYVRKDEQAVVALDTGDIHGYAPDTLTPEAAEPAPEPTPDPTPAPDPGPASWRRIASFETDLNTGTDGWNLPPMSQVNGYQITRTNEVGGADGSYAAKIVANGGNTSCGCPRMKFEDGFRYTVGRDVWIGGSWYFPDPSAISWSRMMNLTSYTGGSSDYYTGLVIDEPAGVMIVLSRHYHSTIGQKNLVAGVPIPAGRWFTVLVHLRLSNVDGQALTEMYLDGTKVGDSTAANMMSTQPFNSVQYGMPYFLNTTPKGTTVYFDHPRLAD
jgi:hypothetical protein